MDEPRKPRLLTRPDVLAWAMYDWANSAFSTLQITIVVVFFSEIIFPKSVYGTWSGSAYAFALAAATLAAGLLSPIVGALADARLNKHSWLQFTALAGVACSLGMAISPTDSPWLPTALFMGALFFFELSYGFANAFLPDLASEVEMNRVSAFGFSLGYIGGALALITAIVLIKFGDGWGWTGEEKLRGGLAVMGAWWGIFSLPAIFLLKDRRHTEQAALESKKTISVAIKTALGDVRRTLGDMRNYRMLMFFLVGFLLYNDCVQTVISQASNFAKEDLGFQTDQLIMVVLMIQFVALPGAIFMGWLSDRIGERRVLFICLASWAAILLSSWLIADKSDLGYDALAKSLEPSGIKLADVTAENAVELKLAEPQRKELNAYLSNLANSQRSFWIMGVCVALVMGGIQSVSRAIMGKMTPPEKSAEFFGFFNLSSKATCFIGPAIFGGVYTITGKYKLAILSLLVQLILGVIVVMRVNIEQGRRDARGGTEA